MTTHQELIQRLATVEEQATGHITALEKPSASSAMTTINSAIRSWIWSDNMKNMGIPEGKRKEDQQNLALS